MRRLKILYAGDSPRGGPANYLLAILRSMKADFLHVPPSKKLGRQYFNQRYDAVILSDFPNAHMPHASQKALARQVKKGTGLLMVGGWGSFSGPFGRWRGSEVEKLLPIRCLGRDDRIHLSGGALIGLKKHHPMFQSISFKHPPVICGLNRIQPRKNARVLLSAKKLHSSLEYPLLVIDPHPRKRIVAFATDAAPHWCGGLVDWGRKRVRLAVTRNIRIEVGDFYVRFFISLLRWLSSASSN